VDTDNLFHRRRAKQAKDLARKKAKRSRYAKVLIVTEGEKTEPNYFNELKDHLELNSANIRISGDCGSGPISVVKYAMQQYRSERDTGDPFDKVFCVFDRDAHASYQQALDKLEAARPKETFFATNSVPCFEYWLLLHFGYTTAQFQAVGASSACDRLIEELRKYMPAYQKNDASVFDQLISQLPQAKIFAARALKEAQDNQDDNPSTKVHELIEYLENIKSSI